MWSDNHTSIIVPDPHKYPVEVTGIYATWTGNDWRRKTGYMKRQGDKVLAQLEPGISPANEKEMDHFDFCCTFGMSYLTKPAY